MWKKRFLLSALACLAMDTASAAPAIISTSFAMPADIAAVKISRQLTERHFKIVDDLNVLPRIHKGNPQLAARIPPDIQAERLLVVCHSSSIVGYLRTDPAATSLCPLTLSLVQINGKTTAYYLQRSALLTDNTAARAVGQKTDESVLDALHAAQKQ
jgi:hypothetical protein